ncbi:hypothetical protein F2Q70_00031331 [Brassica cretica]|uniref:Uncharacterized protein n=1 Tax=Brassica cretica TaxID=69181 RepID=A0A8S9FNK7_BRACR|nr:hypothetical protein F2Q70_00031331 [Brassica cretica]
MSQSLTISHILLLHCFSLNHLSTTTKPTRSSCVTSPMSQSQAEEEKSGVERFRVELDGRGGRDGHRFSTSTKEGGEEDATTARWRKKMEERKIWWRRQQRAGPSSGVERTMTTASRSEPRKKTRRHVEA